MRKFVLATVSALVVFAIALWRGLRVRPKPFAPFRQPTPELKRVPLPAGLPEPVARYFRAAVGERVPVVETAVFSGRGTLRFGGITFPGRLRFTHIAGQGYRHYIEPTVFGLPLMKVNEYYLDGKGRMELPFGVVENEPKVDSAANLGLWGESLFLPSIFVTDPRVRWEAIDDHSARLVVPSGAGEDAFQVTFDPGTSLIRSMEAMRWKEATSTAKTPWRLEPLAWERFNGVLVPSQAAATWLDEGTPWLVFSVEELVYNVDVARYIRASGP